MKYLLTQIIELIRYEGVSLQSIKVLVTLAIIVMVINIPYLFSQIPHTVFRFFTRNRTAE